MPDPTILLHTLCAEAGLAAGYGLCYARRWIADGRAMVMSFVNAMGRA